MRPGDAENRVQFLDALRGIGALVVVLQHAGSKVIPEFNRFAGEHFDPGQYGVFLFLIVSGYIIPASIDRSKTSGDFWRRRVFRLFPIYLLTLAVVVVLAVLGLTLPEESFRENLFRNTLVNLTMMQHWFGVPKAIGAYWTLAVELTFYVLSAVWLFRSRRPSLGLQLLFALGMLTLAMVVIVLSGVEFPYYAGLALYVAFAGTLWYRIERGQVTGREAIVLAAAAVVLVAGFIARLSVGGALALMTRWDFLALPWLAAVATFAGFWVLRRREFPEWLLYLGRISYSMYLLHSLVMLAVPTAVGGAAYVTLVTGGTLALSALSYRFIERPFIEWNRIRSTSKDGAELELRGSKAY